MKAEMFSCDSYNGITLVDSVGQYQIINNYYMGPRIIINPHAGGFQDVPFKPDTFGFLPEGVEARELSKEPFINVSIIR